MYLERIMALEELKTGRLIKTEKGVIQFFDEREIESGNGLPDDLIKAFEETGRAQRHLPEEKMRETQKYFGGGVLTNVLEHVGDLTHRLTHHASFGSVYPEYVHEKVGLGLRRLSRGEGFVNEHLENLKNNAEYSGIPEDEMKKVLDEKLLEYSRLHEQVPVYNRIQWYARESAIQFGKQNFDETKLCLEVLKSELDNVNTFTMRALMVNRNNEGEIVEFVRSDLKPNLALKKENSKDVELSA
jgi:hypothetical protein